jgi:hypothetical protein
VNRLWSVDAIPVAQSNDRLTHQSKAKHTRQEAIMRQLQELNGKVSQLAHTDKGLENNIGEQVQANVQTTQAMVKSLVASNPNAQGVLTGIMDALKKLI